MFPLSSVYPLALSEHLCIVSAFLLHLHLIPLLYAVLGTFPLLFACLSLLKLLPESDHHVHRLLIPLLSTASPEKLVSAKSDV